MVIGLIPGKVYVKNINKGRDPKNSRYQLFLNIDSGLEIRCRCDNTVSAEIFALGQGNDRLFYPLVITPEGDSAYLLAPPIIDHAGPDMAAVDLKLKRDFTEKIFKNKHIFLSSSKTFHRDQSIEQNRRIIYPFKYEIMVHIEDRLAKIGRVCQALIYRVSRHYKERRPQSFKHVDAHLLSYYEDEELLQSNLNSLEYILDHEENMWFDKVGKIRELFENITEKVGLEQTDVSDVEKGVLKQRV